MVGNNNKATTIMDRQNGTFIFHQKHIITSHKELIEIYSVTRAKKEIQQKLQGKHMNDELCIRDDR